MFYLLFFWIPTRRIRWRIAWDIFLIVTWHLMDLAKYSLIKEIIVLKFRDDHRILLSIDFQSAWTYHLKYIGITATFLQVTSWIRNWSLKYCDFYCCYIGELNFFDYLTLNGTSIIFGILLVLSGFLKALWSAAILTDGPDRNIKPSKIGWLTIDKYTSIEFVLRTCFFVNQKNTYGMFLTEP